MTTLKTSRIISASVALLCLSASAFIAWTTPAKAVPIPYAQADANPSTLSCPEVRKESQRELLNDGLQRAKQNIAYGRFDQASQLLVRILESIQQMQDSPEKVRLIEEVVGFENFGTLGSLGELVKAAPPQNPQAAMAVLSAAFETTETLDSSYSAFKTRTLTTLANDATQLKQADLSDRILSEALASSNTIRGAEFKTVALSGIAEAYLKAGQPGLIAPILAQSLQFAKAIDNLGPFEKTTAIARVVSLYDLAVQPDRALQILQSIPASEYSFDTLTLLVNRYSKAGQIDQALELLKTSQPADKAALLAAIAGQLTATQPERATELYAKAVSAAQPLPTAELVLAVIDSYIKAGGLVAAASDTAQTIDEPTVKAPALGIVAIAYADAGQEDLGKATMAQAIAMRAENGVLYQLVRQTIESDRYEYIEQITQALQSDQGGLYDLTDTLKGTAEIAIAENRYDQALELTRQIPSDFSSERDRLFPSIARGLAQTGAFDRAEAIAQEESTELGFQSKILAIVAAQMRVNEQNDSAATLFDQAIQLANKIESPAARAGALVEIAAERLRANQPDEADQLIEQAIAAAQTIEDTYSQVSVLESMTQRLVLSGGYQTVLPLIAVMPDSPIRRSSLYEAADQAVNAGDFATVATLLDQIDEPASKTRLLVSAAKQQQLLGNDAQAANTLNQALQAARTIPQIEPQTSSVAGESLSPMQDYSNLGDTLPLQLDNYTQDENALSPASETLGAIALGYAQIGQVSQALEVAQMIENQQVRQSLIERIRC